MHRQIGKVKRRHRVAHCKAQLPPLTTCVVMRCDFKSVSHAHISTYSVVFLGRQPSYVYVRSGVYFVLNCAVMPCRAVHLNHRVGIEAERVIGL